MHIFSFVSCFIHYVPKSGMKLKNFTRNQKYLAEQISRVGSKNRVGRVIFIYLFIYLFI